MTTNHGDTETAARVAVAILFALALSACSSAGAWDCRNACYHRTGSSFTCGCN